MLVTCIEPGCKTIVMGGGRCLAHEPHENRIFLRGRPYAPSSTTVPALTARKRVVPLAASDSWRIEDVLKVSTGSKAPK